ncbi:MAG: DMT family transporter [Chitinophagia bacterium]|nr:DMT family transporter [Chitinophagia bacterium]
MIYIKLVLVALMWGGTFIATKMAAQTFGSFTGASFRYAVALLFLLPMAWLKDKKTFNLNRKQFFQLLVLGLTGIFGYSYFFFNGLRLVEASHGALIVALNPVLVLIMTSIRDKKRIGAIKIIGMFLSIIGLVVVISRGNIGDLLSGFSWGDAFMLGCPICWALYTFYAGDALKTTTPLQASTWATILGFCLLTLCAPFEPFPTQINPLVWLAIAYLGICGTVLGFVWYYEGISKIGAVKTSAFNNLIPVFAMILSILILGEHIETYAMAGSVFVIGGVFLINRF